MEDQIDLRTTVDIYIVSTYEGKNPNVDKYYVRVSKSVLIEVTPEKRERKPGIALILKQRIPIISGSSKTNR